jgi:hypothetical protein
LGQYWSVHESDVTRYHGDAVGRSKQYAPVDIAVVFPATGVFFVELYTGKGALLPSHGADELDEAMHCAGHVDGIADFDFLAVTAEHLVGCSRIRCGGQSVEGSFPRDGLAVGDTEVWMRCCVYVLQGK